MRDGWGYMPRNSANRHLWYIYIYFTNSHWQITMCQDSSDPQWRLYAQHISSAMCRHLSMRMQKEFNKKCIQNSWRRCVCWIPLSQKEQIILILYSVLLMPFKHLFDKHQQQTNTHIRFIHHVRLLLANVYFSHFTMWIQSISNEFGIHSPICYSFDTCRNVAPFSESYTFDAFVERDFDIIKTCCHFLAIVWNVPLNVINEFGYSERDTDKAFEISLWNGRTLFMFTNALKFCYRSLFF